MAKGIDKVIVTNVSALRKKYLAGYSRIESAIAHLIKRDKERGLTTVILPVDEAASMAKVSASAVTKPGDPRQNKTAVDAIFKGLKPDYLMLLGSIDVIPHQDLINPAYSGAAGDPDRYAYGDLPYACDAAYSQKIADFTGPTRVLGRLPDLTGGNDPAYLEGLLQVAARYKSRPRKAYGSYLGISAKVWQKSTAMSLSKVFGNNTDLQTSPPKGPKWSPTLLTRLSHFINCHGAAVDPSFYGQQGPNYPEAHLASWIAGKIGEGTVAAAECCYGAELYDPSKAGGQAAICNTYLEGKAYGYFGSSTIAYGPASGNGSADLITQFLLKHVLNGASLGRAALQARQDFLLTSPVLDPVDLKTLAQFSLMGDPAIVAVESAPSSAGALGIATKSFSKRLQVHAEEVEVLARSLRRDQLMAIGTALQETVTTIRSHIGKAMVPSMKRTLEQAAEHSKMSFFKTFELSAPSLPALKRLRSDMASVAAETFGKTGKIASLHKAISMAPTRIHLAQGIIQQTKIKSPQIETIVAREIDGNVIVRKLYSR